MKALISNSTIDIIGKGIFSNGEDILATVRAYWKAIDDDLAEGMFRFRSISGMPVSKETVIVSDLGRFEVVGVNQSVNKQLWEVAVCKETSTKYCKTREEGVRCE